MLECSGQCIDLQRLGAHGVAGAVAPVRQCYSRKDGESRGGPRRSMAPDPGASSLRPNGAYYDSPGQRPGTEAAPPSALKGRTTVVGKYAPSGLDQGRTPFPRALPWAIIVRSFGAERASVIHQDCGHVLLGGASLGQGQDEEQGVCGNWSARVAPASRWLREAAGTAALRISAQTLLAAASGEPLSQRPLSLSGGEAEEEALDADVLVEVGPLHLSPCPPRERWAGPDLGTSPAILPTWPSWVTGDCQIRAGLE